MSEISRVESPIIGRAENPMMASFKSSSMMEIAKEVPGIYQPTYTAEETVTRVSNIHAPTDNTIADETIVYFYKDTPMFIDFLFANFNTKSETNHFDKVKVGLTKKVWKDMTNKEKNYYTYHKIQYYNNLIKLKEDAHITVEKMVENKNREMEDLQRRIHDKENQLNNADLNAELATEGESILAIHRGLKDEMHRLKGETDEQEEIMKEFEEKITQLQESVNILEMKSSAKDTPVNTAKAIHQELK